jgi:hypothetical protein
VVDFIDDVTFSLEKSITHLKISSVNHEKTSWQPISSSQQINEYVTQSATW